MDEIITRADLNRIEEKVDKLADAVNRLVLIEERQSAQGQRIGKIEERTAASEAQIVSVDRKVDQWVNRGMGIWLIASALLWIYFNVRKG